MTRSDDLQSLRAAIEAVDRKILSELRTRMELVDRVARAKLDRASPFRDQNREEQVFLGVRHMAVEMGLDPHEIERLYRQVMDMSIARQQAFLHELDSAPLRVAYQGVEGAYTHLTAQRRYAHRRGGVLLTGHETFRGAVESLRSGDADLALLPIENTTAGSINETYDLLYEGAIVIVGEEVSHIEHCLLVLPGTRLEQIRTVMSHPQALAQCEAFLHELSGVTARIEFDTAGAARRVKESHDPSLAAIASEAAAELFGLEILDRDIQTQRGNFTRFVEVAREGTVCPPDASCKTSCVVLLGHRPGELGEVLTDLSSRGVNLTKLESRPVHGEPFTYRFYLDLEGHAASKRVSEALAAVEARVKELRVLGTYPQASGNRSLRREADADPEV